MQELILDFINIKGQEISSKIEENESFEPELQVINDKWILVKDLVSQRSRYLKEVLSDLCDFEEDVGQLGDVLNHTEVCLDDSENTKEKDFNGLQKQLAKLKVPSFTLTLCCSLLSGLPNGWTL